MLCWQTIASSVHGSPSVELLGIKARNSLDSDHRQFGEEAAVDCIKAGMTNYVLKDRLFRLPIVLE